MRFKLSQNMQSFRRGALLLAVVCTCILGRLPLRAQIPQQGFQIPFTVKNNSAQVIIPNCGASQKPTPAVPCIPNFNQVGHTITFSWTSGGTLCTLLADGSNDNITFETQAAANSGTGGVALTQQIGTGTGAIFTFTGTLSQLPLPTSVTVTAGAVSGSDNGAGVISGAGIAAGSVSYTTGAISVTFTVAPANTVPVVVAYQNSITTGMTYFNGYYNFIRIKLSACPGGQLKAVYTGYGTSLPPTLIADATFRSTNVASPVKVTNYGTGYPYVIKGFQIYNPTGSPVYVQFFKKNTTPTLGTNVIFEIGVGSLGGAAFSYTGPDIPVANLCCTTGADNLWVGAATAPGGNTAASAVIVDVETNGTGPFYPVTPFSP